MKKKLIQFDEELENILGSYAKKDQLYKEPDDNKVRGIMIRVFPFVDVDTMETY